MTSNSRAALAVFLAGWLASTPALAETETMLKPLERPDAATVAVPDMAFTPGKADIRRFDDYFYFHKDGVSYDRAFADLDQCRMYGQMVQLIPQIPAYVPLGGDAVKPPGPSGSNAFMMSGFVGVFLAEIIIANAMESRAIATERKCLAYKGYLRYGTSRNIFKQIDGGTDTEKLARKALIASGPAPQTEAIEP